MANPKKNEKAGANAAGANGGGGAATQGEGNANKKARNGSGLYLERALVLDTVRITEQAAIAASRVAGKGDSDLVDQAGVDAMRRVLNELDIDGEIVIGEGERDEAPMLYITRWRARASRRAW